MIVECSKNPQKKGKISSSYQFAKQVIFLCTGAVKKPSYFKLTRSSSRCPVFIEMTLGGILV